MDEDEDNEERDGFGLDKDRRLTERRERKAEEGGPEPLDPEFPYRVISVAPSLFHISSARFPNTCLNRSSF
jgi:hypothetical protein